MLEAEKPTLEHLKWQIEREVGRKSASRVLKHVMDLLRSDRDHLRNHYDSLVKTHDTELREALTENERLRDALENSRKTYFEMRSEISELNKKQSSNG